MILGIIALMCLWNTGVYTEKNTNKMSVVIYWKLKKKNSYIQQFYKKISAVMSKKMMHPKNKSITS